MIPGAPSGRDTGGERGTDAGKDLDGARSARLLFVPEVTAGAVHYSELHSGPVRAVTHGTGVPARPLRIVQQLRYKRGRLGYERDVLGPLVAARRAVLGEHACAPPRFLVRVDEFPHYRAWDDPARFGTTVFERFHEIMAGAGVPYMLAVLPRVSREPLATDDLGSRALDEGERAMLARLASERVGFAQHGLTHRTRHASPRRHSELCGLARQATAELLDAGLAELAACGIRPDVFVPPYNRFDAAQLAPLAQRFKVVCGGPESIGLLGFQSTPQWRGETIYLPAYAPFYGRAAEVLPAVERAIAGAPGVWIPIVLHWGWEADAGRRDLERLVSALAPHSVTWDEFLAAADRSRADLRDELARSRPTTGAAGGGVGAGDGDAATAGDGDGTAAGDGDAATAGDGDGTAAGDGDGTAAGDGTVGGDADAAGGRVVPVTESDGDALPTGSPDPPPSTNVVEP